MTMKVVAIYMNFYSHSYHNLKVIHLHHKLTHAYIII